MLASAFSHRALSSKQLIHLLFHMESERPRMQVAPNCEANPDVSEEHCGYADST